MNRNDEARRTILSSIRRSLAESAPHDAVHAQRHQPPTPADRARSLPVLNAAPAPAGVPSTPTGAAAGLDDGGAAVPPTLGRFAERLEAVAGRLVVVRDPGEAGRTIQRILTASGARRVAVSDAATVLPLAREACAAAGATLLEDPPTGELFDCDVGISSAQWGIAETGSLVLESRSERHRFVSLIPRVHIALLPADRICETLGEALERTREDGEAGTVPSAAVTLVTGPSRTSDIELTLAIGVHGPEELHVIVLEPDGPTRDPDAPAADHT